MAARRTEGRLEAAAMVMAEVTVEVTLVAVVGVMEKCVATFPHGHFGDYRYCHDQRYK